MCKIKFLDDTSEGYGHRTYINAASADVTLAFAVDFTTGGEKCTKDAALKANKLYIPINLDDSNWKLEWGNKLQMKDGSNPYIISYIGLWCNGSHTRF